MKNVLTFCALLVAASNAVAALPLEKGFYIGAMAGATEFEDDGLAGDFGLNLDDSDSGAAIFGGYKFLKHFALEVRVSDLGSYRLSGPFASEDIDVSAVSAHAVGILPLGTNGWELFGQLGIGSVTFDSNCCGDDDETMGSAGFGVRYYPTEHLGISLQADGYAYEDDVDGRDYEISVGATQLGIQYLF